MTFTLTFAEADPADVDRLGGKGAGLARMTRVKVSMLCCRSPALICATPNW